MGNKGKQQEKENKETTGCRTEYSAHKNTTVHVCAVVTYTRIYVYCLNKNRTWNEVYCRRVDQSLQRKKLLQMTLELQFTILIP